MPSFLPSALGADRDLDAPDRILKLGSERLVVKPHVGDLFSETLNQETSSNCLI
jgi:hypothetical protein